MSREEFENLRIFEKAIVKVMLHSQKLVAYVGDVKKYLPANFDLDWCTLRHYVIYDFLYEDSPWTQSGFARLDNYAMLTLPKLKAKIVKFFPLNVLEFFGKMPNEFADHIIEHYLYTNNGWDEIIDWLKFNDDLFVLEFITCENEAKYLQVFELDKKEWLATILLYGQDYFSDFVNYKVYKDGTQCETRCRYEFIKAEQ